LAVVAHDFGVRPPARKQNYTYDSRIMLATFLVNIEVSIVGTSLVTITNSLHGFNQTSWIATGYLVTYTGWSDRRKAKSACLPYTCAGFMVVWSKLSDVIGRKVTFISTLMFFTVFSGACGASQSITRL
jgi:MFS family permease